MVKRVTDNLPRVCVELPKYNVNRELASFNGVQATEATCEKIRSSRAHFLEEIQEFLPMFNVHAVKTRTQWEAFMKVCEKLMRFDRMINQCFTDNADTAYIQRLDDMAEDLIKELGEN